MQLRVARLCLDCEELYTGDGCPRCASESWAYLTTWLPVEERRRWSRGRATPVAARGWHAAIGRMAHWLRGEPADVPGPLTRQGDLVTQMLLRFDEPEATVETGASSHAAAPLVHDVTRRAMR